MPACEEELERRPVVLEAFFREAEGDLQASDDEEDANAADASLWLEVGLCMTYDEDMPREVADQRAEPERAEREEHEASED